MSPTPPAAHVVPTRDTLRRRQKTTADVLTRYRTIDELPDGYEFSYPRSRAWTAKLDEFTRSWTVSCPHMTFETVPDGGPLRLRVRGPEGTKQFLDGARQMLTSHLNPAPSLKNRLRRGFQRLTSVARVMPDFLIIGAKKCGTTALYAYLTQHPSIAPAFRKEVSYFSFCYALGPGWYRSFFPTLLTKAYAQRVARRPWVTGEATPDYLFHTHSPRRVFELLPRARLIVLLRNPVERAYSFYHHNLRSGIESLSFEEALDREPERLRGEAEKIRADETYFSFSREHYAYLQRGVYIDQLEEWARLFPRTQLLVTTSEGLLGDPRGTLGEALEFLGLPFWAPREFKKLNAVPYPEMREATRQRLRDYFEPHNRRLYEFLGRDLGW